MKVGLCTPSSVCLPNCLHTVCTACAWHGMAWYGKLTHALVHISYHGMAQHGMAWSGMACPAP